MKSEVEFSQQDYQIFSTKFRETDISAHKKALNAIEWNTNGGKLVSTSQSALRIWNYDDIIGLTKSTDLKYGHEGVVESMRWCDTLSLLTVSKQAFKIWDIRDNKLVRSEKNEKKVKPDFMYGQWSPDGNNFAISTKQNIIHIYDRRNTGIIQSIKFQTEIDHFAWDHTASVFIVSVWENSIGSLEIRESKTGYPLVETIPCHPGKLTTFQIDPSNQYIATGGQDATVNLYSLQEMLCIRTYHKTDGGIKSLSFSPNSKFLVVGSEQPYLDFYNVESGKHSYRKESRKDNEVGVGYECVRWHPKKDVIAFIEEDDKFKKSDDGKIKILSRRTQKPNQ